MHPDPLHTRIDLQMHPGLDARLLRCRLYLLQLLHRGGGNRQIMLQEERDLVVHDRPLHQDGHVDARLAQQNPFFQESHPQVGGA